MLEYIYLLQVFPLLVTFRYVQHFHSFVSWIFMQQSIKSVLLHLDVKLWRIHQKSCQHDWICTFWQNSFIIYPYIHISYVFMFVQIIYWSYSLYCSLTTYLSKKLFQTSRKNKVFKICMAKSILNLLTFYKWFILKQFY